MQEQHKQTKGRISDTSVAHRLQLVSVLCSKSENGSPTNHPPCAVDGPMARALGILECPVCMVLVCGREHGNTWIQHTKARQFVFC